MSKYTTEVRYICEQSAGLTNSVGYDSIDEVLNKCRDKVFDFDFPIFDENYRATLENKILKHYYTREIGFEVVGLWKHHLCTRMNEIMPYYNQLYKSALIEFNPMYDVDLTTDYQKVDNGNKNRTSETNDTGTYSDNTDSETNNAIKNDHWEYFSDTPEGGINGVADLSYLTNATHVTDDGTGSTSTSESATTGETTRDSVTTGSEVIKNVEDYLHHVSGKSGGASYSKLLNEYRETFLNIDMMVIGNLSDLFMNIW